MENTDLTRYDRKPEAMINYLRYNGPHFSKALAEFACSKMRKKGVDDKMVKVSAWDKKDVEDILNESSLVIENDVMYDAVYVANMCKADFMGSSIEDNRHVALFIKDMLDDPDGYDGMVFNRFLADCARKGVVIDWEEML